MNSTLNRGEWRSMESAWAKALGKGKTVEVKIKTIFEGTSQRPVSFQVKYKIGSSDWIPKSFINQ